MNSRLTPDRRRRLFRGPLGWLATLAVAGIVLGLHYFFRPPLSPFGPPPVIPRSDWGAEAPDARLDSESGHEIFKTVVVHHSAMRLDEGPRDIQYAHMRQRGFLDIGYHFVIDARGRIYEGRSLKVHGAHVREHNAGTLGIVLTGNYEEDEPPDAALHSLKWLVRTLMQNYPITHLAGHQDLLPGQTLCPGQHLEPLLPALAAELGLQFGAGGYTGPEPVPAAPAWVAGPPPAATPEATVR